jgi:hypothetical protein
LPQKFGILGGDLIEIILTHLIHKSWPRVRAHAAQKLCRGMRAAFMTKVRQNIIEFARRATKTTGTDCISEQATMPAA